MRFSVYLFLFLIHLACEIKSQTKLSWGTYLGGSGGDTPTDIGSDSKGNLYVCGITSSTNFPFVPGGGYYQGKGQAYNMCFISKFSPSGQLLWSTPYADTTNHSITWPYDIEIDKDDNVFVAGVTSGSALPTFGNNSYVQSFAGGLRDVFLLKLDSIGNMQWATNFGGGKNDFVFSMSLNGDGYVYIAGLTTSTNFPLYNSGGYYNNAVDSNGCGFVARFSNGGSLLWSTLYPKFNPFDCGIDTSGNLILTGQAFAGLSMQSVTGAFNQNTNAGLDDAAIIKFDEFDNLLWATYFGGSGSERGFTLQEDAEGGFYLLGHTNSSNLPLQNSGGYFKQVLSGPYDAFIARFNGMGALNWSTFYGGSGSEGIDALEQMELDACGNLYVGIGTYSGNMFCKRFCGVDFIDTVSSGPADHFITRFSSTQQLQWATYVGGTGSEIVTMLNVDKFDDLYLAGGWPLAGTGLPLLSAGTLSYYQNASAGQGDVGLVKFSRPTVPPAFVYPPPVCSKNDTIVVMNALLGVTGNFSTSPGLDLNPVNGAISLEKSSPGVYTITHTAIKTSEMCNCDPAPVGVATATYEVFVQPTVAVQGNYTVCPNSTNVFTAQGAVTYYWSNGAQTATAALGTNNTTQHLVAGTSADGCTDYETINLVESNNPSITISGELLICPGDETTLTANGAQSYLWSNGAQTPTAIFSPSVSSSYFVIAYFADGCQDTTELTVTVDLCLGIVKHPIPGRFFVFQRIDMSGFTISCDFPAVFELYDLSGKLIEQFTISASGKDATVCCLEPGIYFLREKDGILTRKVLVH